MLSSAVLSFSFLKKIMLLNSTRKLFTKHKELYFKFHYSYQSPLFKKSKTFTVRNIFSFFFHIFLSRCLYYLLVSAKSFLDQFHYFRKVLYWSFFTHLISFGNSNLLIKLEQTDAMYLVVSENSILFI